jgi:RNA polymerase sigma-70 factor, ECF subfamily
VYDPAGLSIATRRLTRMSRIGWRRRGQVLLRRLAASRTSHCSSVRAARKSDGSAVNKRSAAILYMSVAITGALVAESPIDAEYTVLLRELTSLARALGAGDESEDIAQDALLHGRQVLGQLRQQENLRPWLRRSTVRRALSYRKRASRWARGELPGWAPTNSTLGLDLAAAVGRLPVRERLAIALVYGLGYSQDEAADALGVQRGTIATSLFRARQKLAHALIDYQRGGR